MTIDFPTQLPANLSIGENGKLRFPATIGVINAELVAEMPVHIQYLEDAINPEWECKLTPEAVWCAASIFGIAISDLPQSITQTIDAIDPTFFQSTAGYENGGEQYITEDYLLRLAEFWPGDDPEKPPMRHQLINLAHMINNDAWLCGHDMGLGKTAVAAVRIAWYWQHMTVREIYNKPVLIVAPKSFIDGWPDEMEEFAKISPDQVAIMAGLTAVKREKLYAERRPIYIISYGLITHDEDTLKKMKFDMIFCDEIHRIKDSAGKRNRALRRISTLCKTKFKYGLSGTPAPNGPVDIFGPITFLNEKIFGTKSKINFKSRYVLEYNDGTRTRITGYKNVADLQRRVGSITRYLRKEDAIDLPGKVFELRRCEMIPKQKRIYNDLREHFIHEVETEGGLAAITINNLLTISQKLVQVTSGWVKDEDGEWHAVARNPKLAMLLDLLENDLQNEPVVIWGIFRHEVEQIAKAIGDSAVFHHGGVSDKDRKDRIRGFREGRYRYLVSTAASLREGITLLHSGDRAIRTAVYYSRGYNLLDWLQTQDRVYRIGQDHKVTVFSLIIPGSIDVKINYALDNKKKQQELLLSKSVEDML